MRTWLRGKFTLLFLTFAIVLAVPAIALADTTISDGDDLAPIADSDMALGSVCSGVESSKSAPVFINRNGAASTNVNNNVFANSSTATVTITGVTGAGLAAQMDASPATITLPSDWSTAANNTKSASVSSTVKLTSTVDGPGSGTVTYTATGTNAGGGTVTRTDTMNVSWTTASCDTTAPTVSSINLADANPTNDASVSWNVTFSESVTGVTAADFALANTGLTGPSITGVTGSGANYTVTANTGSGDGTLGLNLVDDDSILDGASNKLGGAGTTTTGNGSFTGAVYTIDRTAPTVTPTADKGTATAFSDATSYTEGNWTNKDVRVTFTCADTGGSLVTTASQTPDQQTFTTQSANTSGTTATFAGTCEDQAGNSATSDLDFTVKIDKTNPLVSLVGGPADSGSYYFGSVPSAPTCSASDALSGLAGLTDCQISGYSAAVGSHTVTASATDNAGNSNSDSHGYDVLAWTLNGFKAPVDMGMKNNAKAGSTVPLKFNVFAGSTELTSTSVVSAFTQKTPCDPALQGDDIEQYATGGTSLRYSGTAGVDGQFIFNWQTPKASGSCYRVTMTTQDGSSISSIFQLR